MGNEREFHLESGRHLWERGPELEAIARAFERLAERRTGTTLLISGPPGIGKTSLLEAALSGARERD